MAAYYGNRSFAYIKTEFFGYALADANKALELDNTYVKVFCAGLELLYISFLGIKSYVVDLLCTGLLPQSFSEYGPWQIQAGLERLPGCRYFISYHSLPHMSSLL